MNKKNRACCINQYLCCNLLSKLQTLENKCDRISLQLSEVKNLITSLPPSEVDTLIDSIERTAQEMYEQSVIHRKYVEQCLDGNNLHIIRRANNEF